MSIRTFYRIMVWVPLVLPALIVAIAKRTGETIASGPILIELLAYSLVYGGIPYAALATWATWRIGRMDEPEIRRLMLRSPLIFAGFYASVALIIGIVAGAIRPLAAVGLVGAAAIVVLGYAYVALTLGLRGWVDSSA